ncbi:MAG TPA: hypothetical protein VFE45_09630, partial [Coriobacteriia bacterium]|nr:hypothetical protein [Coriobacteriia bacterium]
MEPGRALRRLRDFSLRYPEHDPRTLFQESPHALVGGALNQDAGDDERGLVTHAHVLGTEPAVLPDKIS